MSLTEEKIVNLSIGLLFSCVCLVAGGSWWASALYSRVASAEVTIVDLQQNNKDIVHELKQINENLLLLKAAVKRDR